MPFVICIGIFLGMLYPYLGQPELPDTDLHYNYGIVKELDGIWYKTTYYGFEDDSQSISVYYGSELFDYTMDNVNKGDFVIVEWKWANGPAETYNGWYTAKWLNKLIVNGKVVFP